MAMPNPVVGLNDNLEFMGRQLHVQTENTGSAAGRIITQVFCGGRVVLSKKSECPPDVCASHDFSKIQQLMKRQHYKIIEELTNKQARILGSH